MGTEVRAVGVEAFDEIYPLLSGFPNHRMHEADWRRMLFDYAWTDTPQRGYAMYADGKAVGFLGTIFCTRELAGRPEKICGLSSWIVLPEHRDASLKLVTPILRLKDCTILNPTPSPVAYGIFQKLGFAPLESERLVLPPLPGLGETARSLSGSFTTSPADLRRELTGRERRIYDDLSSCAVAKHVLLRHGQRRCYVVGTAAHRKRLPFVEIQYISDLDFFWEHRTLAHAALLRSTRAVALWVDARFLGRRRAPVSLRMPCLRLYRPTRKEIVPEMIDGLYSELMNLKW